MLKFRKHICAHYPQLYSHIRKLSAAPAAAFASEKCFLSGNIFCARALTARTFIYLMPQEKIPSSFPSPPRHTRAVPPIAVCLLQFY